MQKETAVFGGGCFWCTEAVFKMLKGVVSVAPGYSGGAKANPTYEEVCSGSTGYVEVVKIEYDPSLIRFSDLLAVFFGSHDPTTKNRQGNDVGEQYRSVVFYSTPEQKSEAEKFIADINASAEGGEPIATAVEPLKNFYDAEEYHKDFYERNPKNQYCEVIINPKLKKVEDKFYSLLKDNQK